MNGQIYPCRLGNQRLSENTKKQDKMKTRQSMSSKNESKLECSWSFCNCFYFSEFYIFSAREKCDKKVESLQHQSCDNSPTNYPETTLRRVLLKVNFKKSVQGQLSSGSIVHVWGKRKIAATACGCLHIHCDKSRQGDQIEFAGISFSDMILLGRVNSTPTGYSWPISVSPSFCKLNRKNSGDVIPKLYFT